MQAVINHLFITNLFHLMSSDLYHVKEKKK
jgi:hypothetical protein